MNQHLSELILNLTGASRIISQSFIQSLWSGYGEILKVELAGAEINTAIVKYIDIPEDSQHPRGWNTARSHARKIRSYEVEMEWYANWSQRCNPACRVARCYAADSKSGEHIIVLEDLNAAGFPLRKSHLDKEGIKPCLSWLASFHALFLNEKLTGLWETGTYWHLATRPDELAAMEETKLKKAAGMIDELLSNCQYQTIVHGDAKVANFCFSSDMQRVAAVDFQYVGGGCGMKDVAYLLGSCLTEQQCELWESELLDFYFDELKTAIKLSGKEIDPESVKAEWLPMFAVAWTDFYRFLLGWMPTHKKVNAYSQQQANKVLGQLNII